jgi:SAM-dependent methyltransferase
MESTKSDNCCVVECERPLDQTYWNNQYLANATGWDLGQVSPPIKAYFDTVTNKEASILIPGCGNSYEAEYLLAQGFTNITVVDIAPALVNKLQDKFGSNPNIQIVLADFFELEGYFDYIIEQTFFCALPPTLRQRYVWKMHQLLASGGKLVGLLFNRDFEVSPPFGGSVAEYTSLFKDSFLIHQLSTATNSTAARSNTELFIELEKDSKAIVSFYKFEGITCSGCKSAITEKLQAIPAVSNVSINTKFDEMLVVSNETIAVTQLQHAVSYDAKYQIIEWDKKQAIFSIQ